MRSPPSGWCAAGLPSLVITTDHSDWVLPAIAVTIGPLLLWIDHRVRVPRYRPVGWTIIVGPVILSAIMSGTALAATNGVTAGALLLVTAAAGFHDLSAIDRTQTKGGEPRSRCSAMIEARDLSTTLRQIPEGPLSYIEGRSYPATSATTCSPTECTKPPRRRHTDDRTEHAVENNDDVPLPQRVFG
jgi:hypothetical protein